MRIDLIAQRPDLRGLRGAFRVGEAPLRRQGFLLRLRREVKSAPSEEEKEPGDREVECVTQTLQRIELVDLGEGQHQRLLRGAFNDNLLALLDDSETLASLKAELLLALAHQVFDQDQGPAHRKRTNERSDTGNNCLAANIAVFAKRRDGEIDQKRDHDAYADHDQLVLERRPGIRPEERAGGNGRGIEQPETEDGFDGERPIPEPGL